MTVSDGAVRLLECEWIGASTLQSVFTSDAALPGTALVKRISARRMRLHRWATVTAGSVLQSRASETSTVRTE